MAIAQEMTADINHGAVESIERNRLLLTFGAASGLVAGLALGGPIATAAHYPSSDATKLVASRGFENVEHTDTNFFNLEGCGTNNNVEYVFTATNDGEAIEVVVGSGFLKLAEVCVVEASQ